VSAIPLQSGIIYGPVKSRRLGWSLELNISPTGYKFGSFNCVYCDCGPTMVHGSNMSDTLRDFPSPDDFARALGRALRKHKDRQIDNITFSGNGEPTLHPQFEELVDIAGALRQQYVPKAKLGILSNSSTACLEKVRQALGKLDFRIMKLDVGNPKMFQVINRPCKGMNYDTIVNSLKTLENVTLQTMFINGKASNVGKQEVSDWIERVGEIKPVKVQIYSLRRPLAAAVSSLREVSAAKLADIAAQTEEAAGVTVEAVVSRITYDKKVRPAS